MLFAISLTLLSVCALGFPFARWDAQLRKLNPQVVGTVFGRGLLLGYALGLVAPSIRAFAYALVLPIIAAVYFVVRAARRHGLATVLLRSTNRESDILGFSIAMIVLAALFFQITSESINTWDARSIWYYHAKVLYYFDHALGAKLWLSIAHWSHLDYPKLNAMWATLWMLHFDGWNEYLPKFSLFLLQIPAVFLCIGFSTSLITRLGLLAVLILRNDVLIWSGYMDGMLATYAALAVLYAGRYVMRGASIDLMTTFVAAGLCAGLKNEGLVFASCCVFFMSLSRAWQVWISRNGRWRQYREVATTALYAFLGSAIWKVFSIVGGLSNDLFAADRKDNRLHERLTDGKSLDAIWNGLNPEEERSVFVFLAALMFVYWAINWRSFLRHRPALLFGVFVPATYLVVLVLVYLTTPYDLGWHLQYSVDRTRAVLHGAIAMAFLGPMLAETRAYLRLDRLLRWLEHQTLRSDRQVEKVMSRMELGKTSN